jgi:hypothetical protein
VTISPDVLVATRASLHRAAEHLLSATLKRATGEIALLPAEGGVRTPELPDGTIVALDGLDVVVSGPAGSRRAALTTLAGTAAELGLEAGFPWSKHPPGTPFEPDVELAVDAEAAAELARWFLVGRDALSALVAEIRDEGPSAPVVFPEHFDLGVTSAEVNYGFSPGDEVVPSPYAYVGPWAKPAGDSFWNLPFGAARSWEECTTPAEALEFFRTARHRLGR